MHDFSGSRSVCTKGYPKDGRWELNRFVLGMATNQMGIPVFLKSFSGNTQDKKSIVKMIGEIQKNLKFEDKIYYLADSALYTEANIQEISDYSFWISRASNTITETQTLCMSNLSMTPCIDERYAHYVTESKYGDISQQWVVYQSFERLKLSQKKKAEELKNKLNKARFKLKKLMSNEFTSEDKALKAAEKWIQKKPMYQFTGCTTICKKKRKDGKRGRPKKDEVLIPVYFIKASIEEIAEQREKEMNKSGRFVLATNDTSIDPDTLLANYKNQIQVERGFRFLKDKSFLVSEVFLKKPERIEAPAMIMVLCLFVYAVAEFRIRKRLKDANQTVLNQKKKPTQLPTMKWIFFRFWRVREIILVTENTVLKKVVMMKDELWKICRLLGPECEKYYVDLETCGI
ncbi:MAG: IS1634 family transposase [Euryarchaeota archaeon]|nr:IS1634 family transposase [Euryarchaeota archaeon]